MLAREARVITLHGGEVLFHRGDANTGLFGVLDGAICFGAVNAAGREFVAGLAEPSQWFGEVALLDGGTRTHRAWADSQATLAHVPLPPIAAWLAAHPAHWQCIGQLAVHKLRVMFGAIEDAGLHSARDRLVRCLVLLARAYGQREAPAACTLRVSQERLVALQRGRVRVLDLPRLLALEAAIR